MKLSISPLTRSNRLLIIAVVLVPAILFLGAAWKSRADALREGENEIARSLVEMRDHLLVVLQAEELTLASVDDHIHGLPWSVIAKPDTSAFLQVRASQMPGIEAIWLADREGIIQAGSKTWEPGARVAEQQ